MPIIIKSDDEIADAMVRVKGDFWGYEDEYRIIGHEGAAVDWGTMMVDRLCPFPPEFLCGITLGMKTSSQDRKDYCPTERRSSPRERDTGRPYWATRSYRCRSWSMTWRFG